MIWLLAIVIVIGFGWFGWPMLAALLGSQAVTDKPGALQRIAQLMRDHDISLTEVELALRAHGSVASTSGTPRRLASGDIAKTLFTYLGAIFILAGIGTYIGMFWQSMGSALRILLTLGVGYLLLVVLISALYERKYPRLEAPLVLATAFMLTSGWFVLIDELFPHGDNWRHAVLAVFGMMTLHQGLLLYRYRLVMLALTALFFTYGFMQVGLDLLGVPPALIAIALGASLYVVAAELGKTSFHRLAEPGLLIGAFWLESGLFDRIALATDTDWAGLVTGLCVISTAYGLQRAQHYPRLVGVGYFAGSVLAYAGLFDLVHATSAELLFLAATASMLYACVTLQSRALLLTTVLAMLGFIGYYGAEHFANAVGWPVTLVLMGVAFLGVSVLAMRIRRQI